MTAAVLTPAEVAELDVLAFGSLRQADRRRESEVRRHEFSRLVAQITRVREVGLIASLGAPDATVQRWAGVIGAEGQLTGDGRLIEYGALSWAALPLQLRYAPADHGGHDGAVLVGRIDSIERRKDGTIWAAGVLDLGSDLGREAVRLIRGGYLGGVSMDLDGTTTEPGEVEGTTAAILSGGRVRAATLVSIPAFDVARIDLLDDPSGPNLLTLAAPDSPDPDDCGCAPLELRKA